MIPDFDDTEIKVIDDALKERYGVAKQTERCDVEMRFDKDDYETIDCPSVYWEHNGCHFIVSKIDNGKYFSQFFYNENDQFSTSNDFFTDLPGCLMTTLQLQADHEREKNMQQDSLKT